MTSAKKEKIVSEVKEAVKKKVMPPRDPELDAISRCNRMTSTLSVAQRRRVFRYLLERVEETPTLRNSIAGATASPVHPIKAPHPADMERSFE